MQFYLCATGREEKQGKNYFKKPLHWVVVMAKVDQVGPNGEFYNNRFSDGKCDPLGPLWAGKSLSLWLESASIVMGVYSKNEYSPQTHQSFKILWKFINLY